jgi:hypothetical protein
MRFSLALALAAVLFACGRSEQQEVEIAAAPVRALVAKLDGSGKWPDGRCLCVGHFRDEAVRDFPAGVLDGEFARHRWLRRWSDCEAHYGRMRRPPGCQGGLVDYVCSLTRKDDSPRGTERVVCHVNGQSEALQAAGYLADEYDVREEGGRQVVHPVSVGGSSRIHE